MARDRAGAVLPLKKTPAAARGSRPSPPPTTPDGRYLVVRGRLWRCADPSLPPDRRQALVDKLMSARRALRGPATEEERAMARQQVDAAKRGLGERGPVWWSDGAPDLNRHLVENTPYAGWFRGIEPTQDAASGRPERTADPAGD